MGGGGAFKICIKCQRQSRVTEPGNEYGGRFRNQWIFIEVEAQKAKAPFLKTGITLWRATVKCIEYEMIKV